MTSGRLVQAAQRLSMATEKMAEQAGDESLPLSQRLEHRLAETMRYAEQLHSALDILKSHPDIEQTLKLMDVLATLGMR